MVEVIKIKDVQKSRIQKIDLKMRLKCNGWYHQPYNKQGVDKSKDC